MHIGIESVPLLLVNVFFGLIVLALSVFWIVELVDCVRREFPDPTEKIMWVLIIIFTHGVGAFIYWVIGKSRGTLPGETAAGSGSVL